MKAKDFLIKYTFQDEEEAKDEQNETFARMMESFHRHKLRQFQVIDSLELDIQMLIDKYEAEKKKAFENMQTMKGHEMYPSYEATWNNCLLFLHSLEDLQTKLNCPTSELEQLSKEQVKE